MAPITITRPLAALALAAASTSAFAAPASACSLLGEPVTIAPNPARAGATVTVTADGVCFFDGPLGADCSGLDTYSGPLQIGLRAPGDPDGAVIVLGSAVADAEGDVPATSMTVPAATSPGTYAVVVLVDEGEPMPSGYPAAQSLEIAGEPRSTTTSSSSPPTTAAPTTTAAPVPPPSRTPSFTG